MTSRLPSELHDMLVWFSTQVMELARKLPADVEVVLVMRPTPREDDDATTGRITFAANVDKNHATGLLGLAFLATSKGDPDHLEELHRPQ